MDISSTTSSTSSAASTASSTASQAADTGSVKQNSSSFKDEMNKVENKSEKVENKENDINSDNNDMNFNNENEEMLSNGLTDPSKFMSIELNMQKNGSLTDAQNMLNRQISDLSMITGARTALDYSNIEMSADDAKFFTDLVQNTDKTLQGVVADLQGGVEENVQKASNNVKVSSALMNTLSEAVKTNQPFRINFDKDISVIIKIDKDGAVSATFIPGDKAVEEYLRQNISTLKQRFDNEELPYRDLSYSRQKQKRQQKENDNE